MASAVLPLNYPASSSDPLADIKPLAAAGYFQAIAYWLNHYLVPQNLYAQVLADEQPGRLKILIEFERLPKAERLLRFVGDRLYKLESNIIQGAYLIVRPIGTGAATWEKSIRIPTVTERQQKERQNKERQQKRAAQAYSQAQISNQISDQPSAHPVARISQPSSPIQSATPLANQSLQRPSLIHESTPVQAARQIVRSQFKFFRAALVTGTAAIAIAFGGLTELVAAGKLAPAVPSFETATASWPNPPWSKASLSKSPLSNPSLSETPWYDSDLEDSVTASPASSAPFTNSAPFTTRNSSTTRNPTTSTVSAIAAPAEQGEGLSVSFRPASRFQGRTVEAALETIAVVPHDDVIDPADPTVTLLFSGELELNDFVFEDASSIDNLFSEAEPYQQADISMIGLAEPLANASTSLQEDFYRRTRPQAVKMLKAGGIDIVSLASEGTMTYGSHGLEETLNTLDRQGIYRVGAGRNQTEAHRPEILEVKGQRIAYLGYNPNALEGAKAEKAGIATANSEERQHIIEDIRAIRSQVDWIVVNYRWGEALDSSSETLDSTSEGAEAEPEAESEAKTETAEAQPSNKSRITASQPTEWQQSLAHEAIDAGADLVVGYHPETIQGAEIYRDRAIAYSLGDFVFNQPPLQNQDTAALRVSLRNQQMKIEFLPVTIQDDKLQIAEGDRASSILKAIRNASTDFEQPMRFPTVLKAKPNLKLPDSLQGQTSPARTPSPTELEAPQPSDSDYPSAPNLDQVQDQVQDQAEDQPGSQPAIHPIMQESEALFAPQTEPAEPTEPTEQSVPTVDTTLESKPIDLETEQVEVENTAPYPEASYPEASYPEASYPEASYPELPSHKIYSHAEPAQNDSEQPFIDPFIDPSYNSSAENLSFTEPIAEPSPSETAPLEVDNLPANLPDSSSLEAPNADSTEPYIEPYIEPYAEPLVGPISALPATSLEGESLEYESLEPDASESDASKSDALESEASESDALESDALESNPSELASSPPRPKVFND